MLPPLVAVQAALGSGVHVMRRSLSMQTVVEILGALAMVAVIVSGADRLIGDEGQSFGPSLAWPDGAVVAVGPRSPIVLQTPSQRPPWQAPWVYPPWLGITLGPFRHARSCVTWTAAAALSWPVVQCHLPCMPCWFRRPLAGLGSGVPNLQLGDRAHMEGVRARWRCKTCRKRFPSMSTSMVLCS